ncbi:hypothetical protein CSV79_13770 [Sporosarcina sp. P13]|nr:hypothetical protein CSV79_13770 [Sporosarcina sp. P13]
MRCEITLTECDKQKSIELNDFYLPIYISTDFDYKQSLCAKLDNYLKAIEGRKLVSEEVYRRTEVNIEKIKEAIDSYYDANISAAKEAILKVLTDYRSNKFIISKLDESPAVRGITRIKKSPHEPPMAYGELSFFRARIGTSGFRKSDFLHIPFNKRGYVTTQRFSIAGVPCMYFGLTSYVCWLELNKPLDREFNVASYEVNPNINVLNLAISQMLINGLSNLEEMEPDVSSLIEFFPLVIATSYKVAEENRGFYSEYIISQLVMQCLTELDIDGVFYISKRVERDSESFPYAVNLAVPMKNNSELYSDFAKKIPLTKPINFAEYNNLIRQPNSSAKYSSYANLWEDVPMSYIGKRIRYSQLIYSGFDDYLFSEDHTEVDDI